MEATILIIDNDIDIARLLSEVISDFKPDWHSRCVENCNSARKAYAEMNPDAVVINLDLPDGCGLELLYEFRSQEPRLPAIVLSETDPQSFHTIEAQLNPHLILEKPISLLHLLDNIEREMNAACLICQGTTGCLRIEPIEHQAQKNLVKVVKSTQPEQPQLPAHRIFMNDILML